MSVGIWKILGGWTKLLKSKPTQIQVTRRNSTMQSNQFTVPDITAFVLWKLKMALLWSQTSREFCPDGLNIWAKSSTVLIPLIRDSSTSYHNLLLYQTLDSYPPSIKFILLWRVPRTTMPLIWWPSYRSSYIWRLSPSAPTASLHRQYWSSGCIAVQISGRMPLLSHSTKERVTRLCGFSLVSVASP